MSESLVNRVKLPGRTYIQRFNRCHRSTCAACAGGARGHGPYWYLCATDPNGKYRRIYLGAALDTSRFVGPLGAIAWDQVPGYAPAPPTPPTVPVLPDQAAFWIARCSLCSLRDSNQAHGSPCLAASATAALLTTSSDSQALVYRSELCDTLRASAVFQEAQP